MREPKIDLKKIRRNLTKIPADKLLEVNNFIEFILSGKKKKIRNIIKFEGIWEDIGFEKITDLETEIRKLREGSTKSLLKRVCQWNT